MHDMKYVGNLEHKGDERHSEGPEHSSSTKMDTDSMSKTGFEIYRLWFPINILSFCLKRHFKKLNKIRPFTTSFLDLVIASPPFVEWGSKLLL